MAYRDGVDVTADPHLSAFVHRNRPKDVTVPLAF